MLFRSRVSSSSAASGRWARVWRSETREPVVLRRNSTRQSPAGATFRGRASFRPNPPGRSRSPGARPSEKGGLCSFRAPRPRNFSRRSPETPRHSGALRGASTWRRPDPRLGVPEIEVVVAAVEQISERHADVSASLCGRFADRGRNRTARGRNSRPNTIPACFVVYRAGDLHRGSSAASGIPCGAFTPQNGQKFTKEPYSPLST